MAGHRPWESCDNNLAKLWSGRQLAWPVANAQSAIHLEGSKLQLLEANVNTCHFAWLSTSLPISKRYHSHSATSSRCSEIPITQLLTTLNTRCGSGHQTPSGASACGCSAAPLFGLRVCFCKLSLSPSLSGQPATQDSAMAISSSILFCYLLFSLISNVASSFMYSGNQYLFIIHIYTCVLLISVQQLNVLSFFSLIGLIENTDDRRDVLFPQILKEEAVTRLDELGKVNNDPLSPSSFFFLAYFILF